MAISNKSVASIALFLILMPVFSWGNTALYFPNPMNPGPLLRGVRMVSADFNGDGLPDIAVVDDLISGTLSSGYPTGGVWIYLAKKGGGYALPKFYPTGTSVLTTNPVDLTVGDLNGDGSPDIVTVNNAGSAGRVSVLINNGDGTFQAPKIFDPDRAVIYDATAVAVRDVTGDGNADVIVGTDNLGTTGNLLIVVPGNGDGTLDVSKEQIIKLGSAGYGVSSIVIADINGDGEPDLVAGNGCTVPNLIDVFINQGGGLFPATPDQSIPAGSCPMLAAGDFNGDGETDIAVANRFTDTVSLLLNQAGTLFDSGTTYNLPTGSWLNQIDVADVDNDGHPDVIVPNSDFSQVPVGSQSIDVLYGLGNGKLSQPVQIQAGYTPVDVRAVDSRRNGLPDLVVLDGAGMVGQPVPADLSIIRNLGNRHWLSYSAYGYGGTTATDMASGDFNSDGEPDIVLPTQGGLNVLLNNGNGGFLTPELLSMNGSFASSVAVGDVNGDGIPDLVTVDPYDIYTFLGKGNGSFQSPIVIAFSSGNEIPGVALGDLDGDGKTDLVIADFGQHKVQPCRGDGAGHFDCSAFPAVPVTLPYRVKLADLNGDGRLDLIVTSNQYDNQSTNFTDDLVYLGNGAGGFSSNPSAVIAVPRGPEANFVGSDNSGGWGIAVGDVNGDGIPDLVIGSGSNMVTVALGNGDGTFGSPSYYPSGITTISAPQYVALADVNGDGKLDIIASNFNDGCISILFNKGNGIFQPPVNYASGVQVFPVLALDMNRNGLPDIVAANLGGFGPDNNVVNVYTNTNSWQQDQSPVALDGAVTTAENKTVNGVLSGSDADGEKIAFTVVRKPIHGTVQILDQATGAFSYVPTASYTGSDTFEFTVSDSAGNLSNSAVENVNVYPVVSNPSSGTGSSGGGGGAITPLGLLVLVGLLGLAGLRRYVVQRRGQAPKAGCAGHRRAPPLA